MKTTSCIKSKCSPLSSKRFEKGRFYIAISNDTIVICNKTDEYHLFGMAITHYGVGFDNSGNEWNATEFSPFYGEITITQEA